MGWKQREVDTGWKQRGGLSTNGVILGELFNFPESQFLRLLSKVRKFVLQDSWKYIYKMTYNHLQSVLYK